MDGIGYYVSITHILIGIAEKKYTQNNAIIMDKRSENNSKSKIRVFQNILKEQNARNA